jgi:hypothetical protein
MNFLVRRAEIELGHFRALGEGLRRILLSYTFFLLASPLLGVLIINPVRFGASYTVIMEVMDSEDGSLDGKLSYAQVMDNELFFNLGRITSILFFLAVMYFSLENALRYVPLVIALTQFLALWPLKRLKDYVLKRKQKIYEINPASTVDFGID